MKPELPYFTEVAELHTFFQEWFNATRPNTSVSFARFADVMHDTFTIISPSGQATPREPLLTALHNAYGVHAQTPIRIWVSNCQYKPITGTVALITYEEWQQQGNNITSRLSTALISEQNGRFLWHHVHETWFTPTFAPVQQVTDLMQGFEGTWAIAGGWAIDLWRDQISRHHHDVDIFIWRDEQLKAQHFLQAQGWQLQQAASGQLTPWPTGHFLQLPIHTIWGHHDNASPDFIELLLNERDETHFHFRRDPHIKRPLSATILTTSHNIPILAPEICLLYKSKRPLLAKNNADFHHALHTLTTDQKAWLHHALQHLYDDHPWLHHTHPSPP